MRLLARFVLATALIAGPALFVASATGDADLPNAPKSVTRVAPTFPPAAYAIGMSGKAAITVSIDTSGRVTGVRTISEDPADYHFGEAAGAALKQWTFPAGKAGDYKMTVNFAWEPPAELNADAKALVECGAPVKLVPWNYPKDLKRPIDARVIVATVIDEDGRVSDVRVAQEDPASLGFGEAAKKAIRQWHYEKHHPQTCGNTAMFGGDDSALTDAEKNLPEAPPPVMRVEPQYPPTAAEKEIPGMAGVVVTIDDAGAVSSVRVAIENPVGFGFGEAAASAVKNWRFPAHSAGRYTVTVKFLQNDAAGVAVDSSKLPAAPAPLISRDPRYPKQAKEQGIEGSADIAIQLDGAGHVTHAAVLSETPSGMGFGAAAYEAVATWRFAGDAKEGAYRVHIDFKLN